MSKTKEKNSVPVRVLLVEDDERLAESLCGYLAKYLYEVTAVATVHAACEEIAQGSFDVIVQDWILPDGDGRIVLDFARANSPASARVVYSAQATSDAESTAAGAHQFVEKSSDIGRLRSAIIRSSETTRSCLSEDPPLSSAMKSFLEWIGERAAASSGLTELDVPGVIGLRGSDFLSRCVAEWYCRKVQPEIRFQEVKCGSSEDLRGDIGDYIFGKCTLRGRESVVTKGVIDSNHPSHLHFSNASAIDAKDVQRVVEMAQNGTYRRAGARRDSCFLGTISLSDSDVPNGCFVAQMGELDVPVLTLPKNPQELCDVGTWNERLSRLTCTLGGLEDVLTRTGVFESWQRLFHCATAISQSICKSSKLLTTTPFFEQAFENEEGQISDWKQISDLPRFIYVTWLLQRTDGNIAEAARIAKLSRPAIYAAMATTAEEK